MNSTGLELDTRADELYWDIMSGSHRRPRMPSVFLSHSSKDKEFVRELYRRLKRDGVDCFFDAESIGWGDNWVRALERALDECEDIVFVLSPDFCNSEWVEVERTSSIAGDP